MHLPRLRGTKRLDDEIHPMLLLYVGLGRGQIMAIEAARPVNVIGNHQTFQNRTGTPGKDGDLRAPRQLEYFERVDDGVIESDVACCGNKAEDFEGLGR